MQGKPSLPALPEEHAVYSLSVVSQLTCLFNSC